MRLTHYALPALALLMLASCRSENPWDDSRGGEGSISLRVSPSGSVEQAIPAVRSVSTTIDTPDVEEFSIRLTKNDGSYSKQWSHVADFVEEMADNVKVGIYTIEAFYGTPDSQGFDAPYFYGSEEVTVLESETSRVDISAPLMNSMVQVEYGDAFKHYFTDFDIQFQSAGHDFVDFGGKENEGRSIYLIPGDISVVISATNQNGQSMTLNAASFVADPTHLYRISYDVYNGEVGEAQLSIRFDDDLTREEVIVDLTEELFSTKAPQISCTGFDNGQEIMAQSGVPYDGSLRLNIVAAGGIKSANLTVESDYVPAFGNSVDLCAATPSQQSQISAAGVKTMGFFRNPDKLASLDLTDFCRSLPEGVHKIIFTITDKLNRISEPVTVTFSCIPIEVSAGMAETTFGNGYADITIAYNGPDPKLGNNPFSFTAQDDANYRDCEIISIDGVAYTRAFDSKNYVFRISIPESSRDVVGIKVYFNDENKEKAPICEFRAPVSVPDFSLGNVDAYTDHAVVMISADSEKSLKSILPHLSYRLNGAPANATYSNGALTFTGLTPATKYTLVPVFTLGSIAKEGTPVEFTTEAILDVPNGDFENVEISLNNVQINQGGPYTRTLIGSTMQNSLTLTVKEPTGWASVNKKTFDLSANQRNSWYLIPSTYSTDLAWVSKIATQGGMGGQTSTPAQYSNLKVKSGQRAMVVRNVGWDATGGDIKIDKKTAGESGYYCSNPATPKYKAAGKLFLGSYAISGLTETYNEGVAFASRPKELKGAYIYTNDNNDKSEKGTVTVTLLSGSTVIGTGSAELGAASGYTDFKVPISYTKTFMPATQLRIMITSSNHSGSITEETNSIKTSSYCSLHEQESRGAQLIVDNLTFSY